MSPDVRSAAIFAVAAIAVFLATPLAIRIAIRFEWLDVPVGYKGHKRATPYLGGAAILFGILVAGLLFMGPRPGLWLNHGWSVVACALVLCVLGTADDRVNLPVGLRLVVEASLAVALYYLGHGWQIFHIGALNLACTVVWVVGVVNAFNLMDNMDGAAASVAAVSSVGAGVLALISGKTEWAPLCFATAGACAGFLPYNLARPARIFMGDGGSLPIGLIVAALTMSVVRSDYPLGSSGVVVAALLVALVILDTTLVTYSRSRGGRPIFSGGRDHLTHRVVDQLGSPQAVAGTLAFTQLLVCAAAIAVASAGVGWVLVAGGLCVGFGSALIWRFERGWSRVSAETSSQGELGVTVVGPAEPPLTQPQPEGQTEQALA